MVSIDTFVSLLITTVGFEYFNQNYLIHKIISLNNVLESKLSSIYWCIEKLKTEGNFDK